MWKKQKERKTFEGRLRKLFFVSLYTWVYIFPFYWFKWNIYKRNKKAKAANGGGVLQLLRTRWLGFLKPWSIIVYMSPAPLLLSFWAPNHAWRAFPRLLQQISPLVQQLLESIRTDSSCNHSFSMWWFWAGEASIGLS